MSSDMLFLAEFLLTAVIVLGFAAQQLWSLKRLKEKRGKPPEEDRRPPPSR